MSKHEIKVIKKNIKIFFRLRLLLCDLTHCFSSFFLGHPSLSTQTQLTFTIIPRNEFSPRCQKNVSWTIDENTPEGTIIGILLCSDDDRDDPNRKMNVHARWSTDSNRTNFTVPFQILTRKYNESQVRLNQTNSASMVRLLFSLFRIQSKFSLLSMVHSIEKRFHIIHRYSLSLILEILR